MRGRWGSWARSVAGAGLLVVGSTACTPLGLARGNYWTGISTGDLGPCPSFDLDLVIDEGRIDGSATTDHEWGTTLWDARGVVAADNRVMLETRTGDPRVTRSRLSWTGSYNPVLWEITLAPDPACPRSRAAKLQRR